MESRLTALRTSSRRGCPCPASAGLLLALAWLAAISASHAQSTEPAGPPRSVSTADESAQCESSSVKASSEEGRAPTPPAPQATTSAESEALRPRSSDPATKLLMQAMGWEESPVHPGGQA